MSKLDQFERYYARNRKEWRKWLEKNHDTSQGVWLIYHKKNALMNHAFLMMRLLKKHLVLVGSTVRLTSWILNVTCRFSPLESLKVYGQS